MGRNSYFEKMMPYAVKAEKETGIPAKVILAQWAHETAYGTSSLAQRANNHGGIKSNSRGRDYVSGIYAGYNSLDSFTRDYIRVMNLSYYDEVRGASTPNKTIVALGNSPYAEDPHYHNKIKSIYDKVPDVTADYPSPSPASFIDSAKENVDNMDMKELKNYALLGAVVTMAFALIKE